MSTAIGQALIDQLMTDLGLTDDDISTGLQAALAERFGEMYEAGAAFFGDNQLAAVLWGVPGSKAALEGAGITEFASVGPVVGSAKDNSGIDDPDTPVDPEITFTLTSSAEQIHEGEANTFTVEASRAVEEDTVVTFQLSVSEPGDTAQFEDFNAGAFNPKTVTILAGETTATFDVTAITNDGTEDSEKYTVLATVDGETFAKQVTILDGSLGAGQTFTLTTGLDIIPGMEGSNGNTVTSGDDLIIGVVDSAGTETTLNSSDLIDAGEGTDTLRVVTVGAGATTALPTNIENVEIIRIDGNSGGLLTADSSNIAGVKQLNITKTAGALAATAADTTDISVAGAKGNVGVDGGQNITVIDATADNAITIGATTVNNGTINVTDSNVGSAAVAVDGGTDVTLNLSETNGSTVNVGQGKAAGDAPTGVVSITSYTDADVTDTLSAINVEGGSTVNVTQKATTTDDLTSAPITVTQGAVGVTGTDDTTSVTVNQTEAATAVQAVEAVEGVKETEIVTFVALEEGESVTVEGLTFTAAQALTAEEVAAAFSDLTATDTQDDLGPVSNGTYTGINAGNFTSGAADGNKVTFTEVTTNAGNNIVATDTAAAGNVTVTQGVSSSAATSATAGVLGVVNGAVTIADGGVDSISTVTVNGYGTTSSVTSDALQTLSLANSAGSMAVETAATALDLTVDNVNHDVDLESLSTIKDLDIQAVNAASAFTLWAGYVENLTIEAAVELEFFGSVIGDLGGGVLTTVAVSGAGRVLGLDTTISSNINSFDASANTGGVTAIVEADAGTLTGTLADYVLSAGNDDVTVQATTGSAVDVKVTAGAGDDVVTLASGINTAGAMISGGAGTDTLGMTAADAEIASATSTFQTGFEGFEKLSLGAVAAATTRTVDLANLDGIDYVVSAGGGSATAAVAEVFTATFADNGDTDASTIAFDGVDVTMAGTEASDAAVATKFATDYNAAGTGTWTATDNGNGTVTFTANTAEARADVAAADFVVTTVATPNEPAEVDVTSTTVNTQGVDAVAAGGLTLNNMANNGTLEVTADGAVSVNITDAATGTADVLNVVVTNDATVSSTVIANDVETLNIEANDVFVDTNEDGEDDTDAIHDLTVSGDFVNSVVVTGDDLTLDTNSTVLTSVDASAMIGGIIYTADGAAAGTTVLGGQGSDNLTAAGSNDVLNGGAGDDTLTGDNLTQLIGGEGADTFIMNTPSNLNSYSTIMDFEVGDIIDLSGVVSTGFSFVSSEIELADTAVFQDYANATVNQLAADNEDFAWFQFGGNTFIIGNDSQADAIDANFENGVDSIIKIAGIVDLSTASYNATAGTLEMV